MTPPTPDLSGGLSPDAALLVAFTRLEGKVDVALVQHSAEIKTERERGDDHEARLRVVEARPAVPPELAARVSALEAKPTISPRQLWTAIAPAATIAIAFAAYVTSLIK